MSSRLTCLRRTPLVLLLVAAAAVVPSAAGAAPPANDDFANARVLEGLEGDVEGATIGATKEALEPDHAGNPGGKSIWFRWTAPRDGQYGMATFGSEFDTLLAVYRGDALGTLEPVAANDDAGRYDVASMLSFRAVAGTVYQVAVDGFAAKSGRVALTWMPAPTNDNFADADAIDGRSGSVRGTTSGATWEPGERLSGDGATAWYRWTAPADGRVSFDTTGSGFDTVLSVFTGTDVAQLTRLAWNDDDPFFGCCSSRVAFTAAVGQSYLIAVDIYEDEWGPFVLTWRPLILGTPRNDVLAGTSDSEEFRGGHGADRIRAGGGDDLVLAGAGDDRILGGSGDDRLFGFDGDDTIVDRSGRDMLAGGRGNDRLRARDSAGGDALRGGPGRDACAADGLDVASSCP